MVTGTDSAKVQKTVSKLGQPCLMEEKNDQLALLTEDEMVVGGWAATERQEAGGEEKEPAEGSERR